MLSIADETTPCVYELVFFLKNGIPYIGLRIHEKALKIIRCYFRNNLIVDNPRETLRLPAFFGTWSKQLGYGGILKRVKEERESDFITFIAEIPQVLKKDGADCDSCHGTGKEMFLRQEDCLSCNGSGMKSVIDWQNAYAISASFTVLLELLNYCKITTNAKYQQLLTVQTITTRKHNGGSLSGEISLAMYNWLKSLDKDESFSEIAEAMRIVFCRLFESSNNYENTINTNGIIIIIHHDCGLYPTGSVDEKRGYGFHSHDADTPGQQFALLAAIAKLQNMAKEAIRKTTQ